MNTMSIESSKSNYLSSFLTLEVLLVGGLSCIVSLAFWMFVDKASSVATVSYLAFGLAFIANHPHFLSSYVLLYSDYKKNIFKKVRYFFSAIVVPVVLASVLLYALLNSNSVLMGQIVWSMFFLVGWHYVKQVFGFVIVSSARQKVYYDKKERNIILGNLFGVWMMSLLQSQTSNGTFDFYGVKYGSLNLPAWTLVTSYWLVGLSFFAVVALQVNRYIKQGVLPVPGAVAAFLSLYVWYIPSLSHPGFAYLIPFFHSIQYLCFVIILKKNQITDEVKQLANVNDIEQRKAWLKKTSHFAIRSLFLGAMLFEFIPKSLDKSGFIATNNLGAAPILVCFLLFINIHHYFIDNAIWRSDNEVVKKYLFQ